MKPPGQQLIHLVLTLAKGGDLAILPEIVPGEQLALAKELGTLVVGFDYLESVEFGELTHGKSAPVVAALRRKFAEPAKRSALKEEFHSHVRRMLTDGEVEKFLPESATAQVANIRRKLEGTNAT